MMTNAQKTEAAQNAATAFLANGACPVSEGLQYILMYIIENEDKYPGCADYMREVLACLCDQITPEQAFG